MHISTSIDGLLNRNDKFLSSFFGLNASVVRKELLKRKEKGHKLIGSEGYDNFDPVNGCTGHEVENE